MGPAVTVFDTFADEYDRWFDLNPEVYQAQLAELRRVLPEEGRGLEVGAGSGRFAVQLGIRYGVDPSSRLLAIARHRGVEMVLGVGESLPYRTGTFDYILMMTVICFMDDVARSFREASRVLRPEGRLIVGFIEKDGNVGRCERTRKPAGRFLQYARFRSGRDVAAALEAAGFFFTMKNLHGFCIVSAQKKP
jgi:SAM-dependent methyltransferase